ncbi:MAG: methylated-DNA--[protein]-cysteine S-methyltransferase [Bacteriovoracia bacterium]
MNHRIAKLAFQWTPEGRLGQVHFSEVDNPAAVEQNPSLSFRSKGLPRNILKFIEQICDYFESGTPITCLDWESFDQSGWTEFQRKVYFSTTHIPLGETRSYAWVSEKLGMPLASRAVGQALRKNPIPILIPCHRVITSQGALGGFMGKSHPDQPELRLKQKLLKLEHEYMNPIFPFVLASEFTSAELRPA